MKYIKVYFQFKFIFQYLGSFPVQAADQGDRAEFVRKQLVSMKVIDNRYDIIYIIEWIISKNFITVRINISISFQEVTAKRPVLMVISLAGIKVTCPQGQVRHINNLIIHYCSDSSIKISSYNFIFHIIILYDIKCANKIIKTVAVFLFLICYFSLE